MTKATGFIKRNWLNLLVIAMLIVVEYKYLATHSPEWAYIAVNAVAISLNTLVIIRREKNHDVGRIH